MIFNVGRLGKDSQDGDTGTEIRRKGGNHAVNWEKNFSSGTGIYNQILGFRSLGSPVNSQDPSASALTFSTGFQKVMFNHWHTLDRSMLTAWEYKSPSSDV